MGETERERDGNRGPEKWKKGEKIENVEVECLVEIERRRKKKVKRKYQEDLN